ncbi:MAG: hypothetical protein QM632_00870 [Micrococcaceae bacterium]
MSTPSFGLLLDVDGPLASPITRKISIPSITQDLITCASYGIPVIFNTGRSDTFINEQVVQPLLEAGFPQEATMYAVCEKGGTWATITFRGMGKVEIDRDKAVPQNYIDAARTLVNNKYSEYMFFDETKYTMVSVEQHEGSDSKEYLQQQKLYDKDALELFRELGIPASLNDEKSSDEEAEFIIEPTIISTDTQSVKVGKDVGAQRAVELLKSTHAIPHQWYSVGDSRSDYAMSDWLYENGFDSIFVDVRPADGVPEKPYKIVTYDSLSNDAAGAKFLQERVADLKSKSNS